ncbi:MAG TPA: PIN domain-containing protein [Candidatus Limnocylindrales bacterium]|nr:PIN domain-containing protein [Candidatus Limnocylindrales bacterium]
MIFVDTSFWIAFRNVRDARNREAISLYRSFADRRLVTTNQVRGETWTFMRRKSGHLEALRWLDFSGTSPRLTVATIDLGLEDQAWSWLRRHDEQAYSFVDATSFVFMRRHGIEEAFAFDEDFSAAGFVELRA